MVDTISLPLYAQISAMLVRDIAAGRLLEGERLPGERDMAAAHGVSVGTLRRALADLTEQGLLERRQGSGNYIRKTRAAGGLYGFFRLELLAGGGMPGAEVLSVTLQKKPTDAPDFGTAALAHRVRRLRRLDGVAAALEEIWLDGARVPVLRAADLSASLYHHYRLALGLRITRVEDRIGVADLPNWCTAPLGVEPGAPCGFVERLSRDQHGQPVEYSRTWFDQTRARYVSRMT